MMVAPATTSPTVRPMIVSLLTPVLCVSAAVVGAAVASVFVSCDVDNGPLEEVADDGEAVNEVVEVEDTADDNVFTDSLAVSSRVRYQLVLQKPSLFCSSVVPWALTILKTKGFVRLLSSAPTSHWYHSDAELARGLISTVCKPLNMILYSLIICTEFATFPLW